MEPYMDPYMDPYGTVWIRPDLYGIDVNNRHPMESPGVKCFKAHFSRFGTQHKNTTVRTQKQQCRGFTSQTSCTHSTNTNSFDTNCRPWNCDF